MDNRRVFLWAALFAVIYSLWMAWQKDFPSESTGKTVKTSNANHQSRYLPSQLDSLNDTHPELDENSVPVSHKAAHKPSHIKITTDVLNVILDEKTGNVIGTSFPKYPESLKEQHTPFVLLNNTNDKTYVAKSSLFIEKSGEYKGLALNYQSEQAEYHLANNQKTLKVVLHGKTESGLDVKKIYQFERGSYAIKQGYSIQNDGDNTWKGYLNLQLVRAKPIENKRSMFSVGAFTGASMSNPNQKLYQKLSFSDMSKKDINEKVEGGWVAMQQHYFLSAWIPSPNTVNQFYTRVVDEDYVIGMVSKRHTLAPGESLNYNSQFYSGPELTNVLAKLAPGLDMTVDYGWLWFISKFLFFLLTSIHSFVGNWGWSIVLVTVLIKLAFYRLSAKSYRSMAAMRELQPKIEMLRNRFKDDKQKLTQQTMELYKKEKVNPLGGCLPILIQIPVFIGLYWVLLESVQLRQAPFVFWLNDLAAPDPFYILPVLMGASMLIQQKMNPPPPDPTQAKVMMALPIVFTVLFLNFPSGLVLYWVVNNSLSILQQWYITQKYSKTTKKKSKPSPKLAISSK